MGSGSLGNGLFTCFLLDKLIFFDNEFIDFYASFTLSQYPFSFATKFLSLIPLLAKSSFAMLNISCSLFMLHYLTLVTIVDDS